MVSVHSYKTYTANMAFLGLRFMHFLFVFCFVFLNFDALFKFIFHGTTYTYSYLLDVYYTFVIHIEFLYQLISS